MSDSSTGLPNIAIAAEHSEPTVEYWDDRKRRNSGTSSDQGRQKKAKALASDSDTDTDMEAALLGVQSTYKRDTNYYFEDGSCILLVEDTLFNVCAAYRAY
jgi:hypothetical protein